MLLVISAASACSRSCDACPLERVVPFDVFAWGAVDPASLLPTRTTGTTIPSTTSLMWEVNELVAQGVVSGGRRPSTKRREQNPAYQQVLGPNAPEYQLRTALVVDGTQWGLLHIERRRPDFTASEVALVDALVPHLAHAFRRWILADAKRATGTPTPVMPGVIVLDEHTTRSTRSVPRPSTGSANGDSPISRPRRRRSRPS